MTVGTTTSSITHLGNASTTVWTFPFIGVTGDDLEVIYVDTDGNSSTLNPVLYTVSITTTAVGDLWGIGGSVTYPLSGSPIATSTSITINRIVPYIQDVSIRNQGAFYPQAIEQGLDVLELQIQQLDTLVGHAIQTPVTDINPTVILPTADARANTYFAFDSFGNPTMLSATPPTIPIYTAQTVATIAALKAIGLSGLSNNNLYYVRGYYQNGDGGQGFFRLTTVSPGADNGGTIIHSNTTGYYYVRDTKNQPYSVRWFGALGDGVTDDTTAITNCITACVAVSLANGGYSVLFPPGVYAVTQISLTTNGITVEMVGAQLLGIASSAKKSILDLRSGQSFFKNLIINGNFNLNYECAVQWYNNNTNVYFVARNQFDGLYICCAKIALCVGALPSQADPIPAAGTVQAQGVATDADISESSIRGLITSDCPKPIYLRQPNGKLTLTEPILSAEVTDWPGSYPTPADACTIAVANAGSELTVTGGEVINSAVTAGALIQTLGTVNIIGSIVETCAKSYIAGAAILRMSHILDFGLNYTGTLFEVDSAATGELSISHSRIVRDYDRATSSDGVILKSIDGFGGSYKTNFSFNVDFDDVEFRDQPFTAVTTYQPMVLGCFSRMRNCVRTSYNSGGTRTLYQKLDDSGPNLLTGVVDVSADQITAFGVNGAATSQGWTFTVTGSPSWGKVTTSLPTPEGVTIDAVLELNAGGGEVVEGKSAVFAIQPQKWITVKGILKTGSSGANLAMIAYWFKNDGSTAASTASSNILLAPETQFATTYSPFTAIIQPPKDAVKMQLSLKADGAPTFYFGNPEVHQAP